MPRRRKRTTNRKPLEERRLRVRGIRRGEPDPKKLSRAFINLALARAEAEARAQAEAEARSAINYAGRGNADDMEGDGNVAE
jgi:hypothetical protein